MKIGISAFAGDGGKSGISQYMINLFKHLPECEGNDSFVLFMAESDRQFLDLKMPRTSIVSYPDWIGHPLINILWHLIWLPLALRIHACDCVFMPVGNRRLGWFYGVPSIGTIHDMSQLHIPAKYDAFRMFYVIRVLPVLMRRLTGVVAISHSTRLDLEGFARVKPERIRVIYNGADLQRYVPRERSEAKTRISAAFPIPENYILYISRLEHPGKNHVRLIEGFAQLKKSNKHLPHKLVLVGSRWPGSEAIDAAVESYGMGEDVIFPGFVANEALSDLYVAADLFVYPSLFEGFGIPPLEAMASGTPVCASNVSSIPEVVGEAALLFDPLDSNDIAATMQKILNDPLLQQTLILKGLQQATKFSWQDASREVLGMCQQTQSK